VLRRAVDGLFSALAAWDVVANHLATVPHSEPRQGFCLAIGACLVPIGALLRGARQPWQAGLFTAMTMGFVPNLQPTNPET
jgi:hypothetical protein